MKNFKNYEHIYILDTVRSPFLAVRKLRFALKEMAAVRQRKSVFNEIFYTYLTVYGLQFEV
jgi:hypothetical protein